MTDQTTPAEAVMRCYANNPAASGFVPVSPAVLRRWADEMQGLRSWAAAADRRMAAAALRAHAERMLEEADSFPAETGAELRDCAAALRRVAEACMPNDTSVQQPALAAASSGLGIAP